MESRDWQCGFGIIGGLEIVIGDEKCGEHGRVRVRGCGAGGLRAARGGFGAV